MVENAFGILVSRFRVLLGKRAKVVRDIVFMCVVLHNMLKTPQGGANRAPTPANDVSAQQNEQAVYVINENCRNPLREAKHQQEVLKDYFNHVSTNNLGQKPAPISPFQDYYQSFSALTNYSKNIYLSWCCSSFQQISKQYSIHFSGPEKGRLEA